MLFRSLPDGPSGLLATLRDRWEGVEPEVEVIPVGPARVAPTEVRASTRPSAPRPRAEVDPNLAVAKALVLDRLRATKEGLRDGILVESVRRALPETDPEVVPRAVAELRREKKIKVAGGRWVRV